MNAPSSERRPYDRRCRHRNPTLALVLALGTGLAGGCGSDDPAESAAQDALQLLPPDTGGVHLAFPRNPDDDAAAPYGFHLYLPSGWETSPVPYPFLLFLHGAGERGDSADDPALLDLVLRNGPPRLIARGEWAPPHPMIVASPQCHDEGWDATELRALLAWLDERYPLDASRLYLTGLSMGGFGTWSYLGRHGDEPDDSLPIAAAVPICGGGSTAQAEAIGNVPVWAFHGTSDTVVPSDRSVDMVIAIAALAPAVPPRLTLYEEVGHDSWSRTYDVSGLGEGLLHYEDRPEVDGSLVLYEPDIYTWMLGHRGTIR